MSIELILVVVVLLASKLGLNSKNSRIPPLKDINREVGFQKRQVVDIDISKIVTE